MTYFENITDFDGIDEWRIAYSERTNNSMPLMVAHEMSKLMKKHTVSFKELAALIETYDGLGGAKKYLDSGGNDKIL